MTHSTHDFTAAQERMRHTPEPLEPEAPLPAGEDDAEYPVNEQHLDDFNVGGVERSLPPAEQLAQLVSYMESSYPVPDGNDADALDRYLAALPDRLTHAAMLMLGSGLDHSMPGVAYGMNADASELAELGAVVFTPSGSVSPTGRWAVSAHPGFGPRALDLYWRPLVAALAQLSGTTIVDVNDPSPDAVTAAFGYASAQSSASVALLSADPVEQHSATLIDTAPLTRPTPAYATAAAGEGLGIIATPEEFRRIVREVAQQLRDTA